ncbi:NAD(P)/FAD-dependent oxidoreductase [Novosphingobium sp.]|uniref:NAD(P)/FAD-dependent oxidoreductase n=1 Tax=Novosphingobium sp. TaxID=1874826 RepID=UPI0038B81113
MTPPVALDIAVIGAGMAGLACADALAAQGANVSVFDKGRGPGGRMSTRRLATPLGEAAFDFGAQYFTVRDPGFAEQVNEWAATGIAARWPVARDDAWVGVPRMNAVIRAMADRHTVRFEALVKGLLRQPDGRWRLVGDGLDAPPFDAVVLALPAEQTAPILTLHDFELAKAALFAKSQPCWTAMYAFAERLPHPAGVVRDTGIIAWAARDSDKPGRSGPESWVVQATPQWSQLHLEDAVEAVDAALLAALRTVTGAPDAQPVASAIHRWRYALSAGTGIGSLWNPRLGLGACGDWLLGPRVECAWLSGRHLAARMLERSRRVA